jgi:hypothetical protein
LIPEVWNAVSWDMHPEVVTTESKIGRLIVYMFREMWFLRKETLVGHQRV